MSLSRLIVAATVVAIILSMLGSALWQVSELNDRLAAVLTAEIVMQQDTYVTTWTSGGGTMTHTVTTQVDPDADPTIAAKRHAAEVAALAAVFTPDAG